MDEIDEKNRFQNKSLFRNDKIPVIFITSLEWAKFHAFPWSSFYSQQIFSASISALLDNKIMNFNYTSMQDQDEYGVDTLYFIFI